MSDDRRQEFILLSDTLGVSMLVVGLNNKKPPGATQATVFGPFFVENSPIFANGDDLANGAPGEPCFVEGRVGAVSGEPQAGAHPAAWPEGEGGFFDRSEEDTSEQQ